MNNVILIGNLTKEVEIKGEEGKEILNNSIAVRRDYKNSDGEYESDFINIVAFGRNAEFISKYSQKGDMVAVEGRLQSGSYTNKEGQTVYHTDVIVDKFKLLNHKEKNSVSETPRTPIITDEDLPF